MKKNKLLLHKQILAAVLSGGMLLLPNWGYALPQGGQVVAGTGSIGAPGGDQMNITGSGNVAIDWNSFNVAQGESVKFSGMQAVLNYVTGNTKSEIFGNISGSGVHVFLVNPNGILFGATASVNVGELTASTRTIDNRKSFDGTAFSTLSPEAAQKVRDDIINLGELTADKILLEGDNISLLNAHMLKSSGNGNITLRADNKVTVGYEVTDKTTINVGDDAPGGHTVSDYTTGTGTKGSTVLAGAAVQDLRGNSKNITDAMLVHDIYELQAIDKNINGDYIQGDYMLAGDIDADVTKRWNSGSGFNPIGNFTSMPFNIGGFNGSLDGAGFVIKDLHININTADGTQSNAGLFDVLNTNAFVHNLTLQGGSITNYTNSSGGSVGSIAGENLGSLKNVFNIGMEISSQNDSANIGGIVGYNKGTVTDAHNSGSVNDKTNTSARIGGIAGYNDNGGVISYSDNNGAVTGKGNYSAAGGIVGYNNGSIKNSFNNGNVTGYGDYLGGIVGENIKDIFDSYNKGEIKGKGYDTVTGGITGINDSGNINNVYNSGIVDSMGYNVGGIVGQNYSGTLSNAYNTGTINGNGSEYVGGIAAINDGEIKNVYNIGKVSGGDYRNVIVVENSGAVSNAYYAVRSGDTILGYKKFGSGTLLTLAEFGKAFEKGLDTASKDSWKFYNGYTDPLLKGFLKKITIDGDSITGGDTVYNGSEQNAGLSGLADGILVGSKKNAGDYDLNDLLYSGQDGYDIEIVNDGTKFIINKAQLTVTADGVEIDANSVLPDFTGSISGLVGGERWEDLGVELDSDLHFTTDADGKTAGKFAINGSLDKTLANYEIKQADSNAAALVVNKNDKPPQPPDLSNLPQEGIYQNALVNLAVAERENRPEQQSIKRRVTDSRISDKEEQVKVTIEGDGIKTE
ncbi:filamentous hemagglutinin N-terminal domain-containing protein [Phascolarctobacterium faecium]|uniref:Filamentous hemagglutinin N-terminal domain-containing protein n=1 Tax=Phascolarctobacterium faecium TaxID=33025 RepID=A0A7X2XEA0_9FIRM|nr:filamentous hemagglutinin N-terminal domain-containing protein [Phascolarctobacterium faecium]MTS80449.1 filamentous hemagglutinin N-terminal domain-containing protein [Phascolarctobacterium faecium]MTT01678.1 filamentous hemagglutinin N-terminal domain-containing protein [Phascolarctobacterium faecium]MTT15763.1 filamentous hemagglutinin N-terminal domain-containing protein [Phascolarctobacterium faecium]MTT33860.1 filamentous hemagglutinin N-terminal domain-containing protein [Phascolarcto